MKKSFKKIISAVLIVAMLIPSVSANAFATNLDTIVNDETEKNNEKIINISKTIINNKRNKIYINIDKEQWKSQLGLDNYNNIVKIVDKDLVTDDLTLVDTIRYKSPDFKTTDVEKQVASWISAESGLKVSDKFYLASLKFLDESHDFLIDLDFNAKVYKDNDGKYYVLLNQPKLITEETAYWYSKDFEYNWQHYHDKYYTGDRKIYLCWGLDNIDLSKQ